MLRLTISPAGTVTFCEVVSSELGDPDLEQRLVQRAMLFQFETKDVEAITTTKPIDFFPAKHAALAQFCDRANGTVRWYHIGFAHQRWQQMTTNNHKTVKALHESPDANPAAGRIEFDSRG